MGPRLSTQPPPARARRRRTDVLRYVSRVLCVVLALVGTLPFAAALVVRAPWARSWAASKSEEAIRAQGVDAKYGVNLKIWPLSVELRDVVVASTDGLGPALTAAKVSVRPRVFALLAGKLAIDEIEVDSPRVRVVIEDGKLANLAVKLPDSAGKKSAAAPSRAPFNVVSLTDARADVTVDGTHATVSDLDLDVTAESLATGGSAFEVAVRAGKATVHSSRTYGDPNQPQLAVDDDVLCSLEARARYEPGLVTVRRLAAEGSADLDVASDTAPGCHLPEDDKRRVVIELNHVHVYLPDAPTTTDANSSGDQTVASDAPKTTSTPLPRVDGRVHVRGPVALAERAISLPQTDGWVDVDLDDLRYGDDTILPDLSGRVKAHGIQLAQYSFAQDVDADVMIKDNVVTSRKATIAIADGDLVLSDVEVQPLVSGGWLKKARLDITNLNFTTLMRDLGIHPHSHVGWDVRKIHSAEVSGTFSPIKIDCDFSGDTANFGIYDRGADDDARQRIFGFSEASLTAHLAVRPDGVHFQNAAADVGPKHASHVANGNVLIGFHEDVRVDAYANTVDLEDISPMGPVKMDGIAKAEAHVDGTFKQPRLGGKIESIKDFVVSDVRFGDIDGGDVDVDIKAPSIDLKRMTASVRGTSDYEVPTAHLDFGGTRGFIVDAFADAGDAPGSHGLGLKDLLWMFQLDNDPRFDPIDARLSTTGTRVHVALGGPEDRCSGGYIDVRAKANLSNISLFGESFVDGNADLDLSWSDRKRGIAGAEMAVRSFVLRKALQDKRSLGTVLGSAQLHEGGALSGNLVVDGLELSRIDSFGSFKNDLEGRLSAVGQIDGMLDDFSTDRAPGFTIQADVQVSPVSVHHIALPGSSAVRVTMRNDIKRLTAKDSVSRTPCGGLVGPPYDPVADAVDTSKHGYYRVDGDLFDREVRLADVELTSEASPVLSGSMQVTNLELGPLARVATFKQGTPEARDDVPVEGTFSGTLVMQRLPLLHPEAMAGQLWIGDNTVIRRGTARVDVVKPDYPILLVGDSITIGTTLDLLLSQDQGLRGKVSLVGGVTELSQKSRAHLGVQATLTPLRLDALAILVPQIEHASGTVEGSALVTGTVGTPIIDGKLAVRASDLMIRGMPSALSDVSIDAQADARTLSVRGTANFGGGTLALHTDVPLKGFSLGFLDASVTARSIHLTPEDGISVAADADLHITVDPEATSVQAKLPHVTGEVLLTSFAYTRPVNLTSQFSLGGAKRTNVDTYDPSQDAIVFNVDVRTRTPLAIKNNLAEISFAIDGDAMTVTGTNQRVALSGGLRALPNGHFYFQTNKFDVEQAVIRFDDPTRIAANVDITAKTEYRRYTDSTAAGASAGGGASSVAAGTHSGALWRITLHAYGDSDDLHIELTSDPSLSQEDIVLLLTVGMTRAELDQLQASALGATVALNFIGAASGADQAVKNAIPVIDDFRFGSGYSSITFKSEPQLTIGKRLTDNVHASVTTGLVAEDRELRSNIEWRLNNQVSIQGTYDNIDTFAASPVGNVGADLRWRLDFE